MIPKTIRQAEKLVQSRDDLRTYADTLKAANERLTERNSFLENAMHAYKLDHELFDKIKAEVEKLRNEALDAITEASSERNARKVLLLERDTLKAENEWLRMACKLALETAQSWHTFHVGSCGIECDELCAIIEPLQKALEPK